MFIKIMKINENLGIRGDITARFYDQSTLLFWQNWINKIVRKLPRKWMKFYQLGTLKFVDKRTNVICNNGLNAIAKLLTNDTTYTGYINKALLGTGTGAAAAATDTKLETEVYRNDMASGTDDDNIAYLTAYFTETECSGTYTEFGNAIDGAVGADTGRLWSHLKGLNWVKDTSTTIVVSQKYTLASI